MKMVLTLGSLLLHHIILPGRLLIIILDGNTLKKNFLK
ncbi:hypothetical protein A79E_1605 [Klebsiella pneumoniae subsp. pneumoniae 1084]|nr:hypothetical protein A79E_1605 [Klebsiella pneumoniae subsp. pneumoniae 1084]